MFTVQCVDVQDDQRFPNRHRATQTGFPNPHLAQGVQDDQLIDMLTKRRPDGDEQ